jgi:hypothetical protein
MPRKYFHAFLAVVIFAIFGIEPFAMSVSSLAQDDPFGAGPVEQAATDKLSPSSEEKDLPNILEDIRQSLDEPTKLDFTETPLGDVIDYLTQLHKQRHPRLNIVLDLQSLGDLGVTPETPITKKLDLVSLRSTLKIMLRDLGMSYIIRDEVLLLTTPEEACYPKVYDVSDIVAGQEKESAVALDSLLGMVNKTCKPPASVDAANWPGWTSSLKSSSLTVIVVNEPEEIQEQVADLLARLHDAKHSK